MSAIQNDFRRLVKRAMGEHPMSPVGAPKWNTTVANSAPSATAMPPPINHSTGVMGAIQNSNSKGILGRGIGLAATFAPKATTSAVNGFINASNSTPVKALADPLLDGADRVGEGTEQVYDAAANPNNEGGRTGLDSLWQATKGVGNVGLGVAGAVAGATPAGALINQGLGQAKNIYDWATTPNRPATTVASPAERGVPAKATQPPSPDGANWGEIIPSLMQMFAQMAGGMGGAGSGQQPGGSPGDYLSQFAGNVNPAMQVAMSNPYVPRT